MTLFVDGSSGLGKSTVLSGFNPKCLLKYNADEHRVGGGILTSHFYFLNLALKGYGRWNKEDIVDKSPLNSITESTVQLIVGDLAANSNTPLRNQDIGYFYLRLCLGQEEDYINTLISSLVSLIRLPDMSDDKFLLVTVPLHDNYNKLDPIYWHKHYKPIIDILGGMVDHNIMRLLYNEVYLRYSLYLGLDIKLILDKDELISELEGWRSC